MIFDPIFGKHLREAGTDVRLGSVQRRVELLQACIPLERHPILIAVLLSPPSFSPRLFFSHSPFISPPFFSPSLPFLSPPFISMSLPAVRFVIAGHLIYGKRVDNPKWIAGQEHYVSMQSLSRQVLRMMMMMVVMMMMEVMMMMMDDDDDDGGDDADGICC